MRDVEETIKEHLCQHRSYKYIEYIENQDLAEILKKIVIKQKVNVNLWELNVHSYEVGSEPSVVVPKIILDASQLSCRG